MAGFFKAKRREYFTWEGNLRSIIAVRAIDILYTQATSSGEWLSPHHTMEYFIIFEFFLIFPFLKYLTFFSLGFSLDGKRLN